MNVSRRKWKTPKSKSFATYAKVSAVPRDYQSRMEERERLKALKETEQQLRAAEHEAYVARRRKTFEKQQRKKENALKTALSHQGVQLLQAPKKIERQRRALKGRVFAVPPELLAQYYGK